MSALIASLFAVGAAPAAAAQIDDTSASRAVPIRTACLGPALEDAGFSDVSMGNAHYDTVNCIAYYGITEGRGDGSFGASDSVTRSQMALFLKQMADRVGANLDDDADAGFSDLDGIAENRVDAINRLVNAGIMTGTGGGTFSPGTPVTRANMAHWLVNFVAYVTDDLSPINVTVERSGGFLLELDGTEIEEDYFADSRTTQARHIDSAIGVAFELGISVGYGDLTFKPNRNVTREEMATFIAQTLAHTNLRPAGLTAQAAGNPTAGYDIQVSMRSAAPDFDPVPNTPVDLFGTAHPRSAFNDDGTCITRWVWQLVPGFTACEIDDGDQVTQDDGNAEFDTNLAGLSPEATTLFCTATGGAGVATSGRYPAGAPAGAETEDTSWAWTGQLDEEVDDATDLFETVVVVPFRRQAAAPPHHAEVSGGLDSGANQHEARLGQVVEYTLQLHADPDEHTGPMGEHLAVGPDSSGNKYNLRVTRHLAQYEYVNTAPGSTPIADIPANAAAIQAAITAAANADPVQTVIRRRIDGDATAPGRQATIDSDPTTTDVDNPRLVSIVPSVVTPDENGTISIPITHPDPDPASNNDDVIVSFTLTAFGTDSTADDYNAARAPLADNPDRGAFMMPSDDAAGADGISDNDDDDGYVHAFSSGSIVFSDDGIDHDRLAISASAAFGYRTLPSQTINNVIVTVLDQYGRPYRGFPVNAVSDQDGDDADGGTSTLPFVQYFSTRGNGSYAIGYRYAGEPFSETLQAFGHESRPERDLIGVAADGTTPTAPNVRGDDPATTADNEALRGDGIPDAPSGDVGTEAALTAGLVLADDGTAIYNGTALRQGLGASATADTLGANDVMVHWANIGQEVSGTALRTDGSILVIDVENKTFVVNNPTGARSFAGRPHVYTWDEYDTFEVGDSLVPMQLFEAILSEAEPKIDVQVDSIAWASYNYFRLNDRARWTINATCTGGAVNAP